MTEAIELCKIQLACNPNEQNEWPSVFEFEWRQDILNGR